MTTFKKKEEKKKNSKLKRNKIKGGGGWRRNLQSEKERRKLNWEMKRKYDRKEAKHGGG